MLNKILYYLRCLFFIIYLIINIFLLPFVLKTEQVGIFFLLTLFLFITLVLFSIFSKRKIYIITKSYNLVIIALTIYIGIVYSRLLTTNLYTVSVSYCRLNLILLSLVMIGIMLNTIILYLVKEGDDG